MKVLIVSQYFWPETFKISEVSTLLRNSGCEVTVLTGMPNYPDGKIFNGYAAHAPMKQIYNNVDVFRVPIIPRGRGGAISLILNYLSFIATATLFGPWLLRGRPADVILVFAPSPILQAIPAIWIARIKQATLVTWVGDLWPESLSATGFIKNKFLLGVVDCVVRWIYRSNDCILVQSKSFIHPVKIKAGKTPVKYHPNPGDLSFSEPVHSASPLSLSSCFSVLFTGNLGTVQSIDTILQAAVLLRNEVDIRFVLVGSGSRLRWIESEINRLGLLNVDLPGRFPPQQMPAILNQASVCLVSLVRGLIMSQTLPSKVQAYFAAGKPVIACLDGEGARIVNEANAGLSCPAEDPVALATVVKKLRDMPEQTRKIMGENAAKYYWENFEPQMLAIRLRELLADVHDNS